MIEGEGSEGHMMRLEDVHARLGRAIWDIVRQYLSQQTPLATDR